MGLKTGSPQKNPLTGFGILIFSHLVWQITIQTLELLIRSAKYIMLQLATKKKSMTLLLSGQLSAASKQDFVKKVVEKVLE